MQSARVHMCVHMWQWQENVKRARKFCLAVTN